jgi:ribosomal protein S18 acetylase RimI-like enzyme
MTERMTERMTEPRVPVSIRAAQPEDGPAILAMLAALALFEGAPHAPRMDAAALTRDVFGSTAGSAPKLNILIAEQVAGNDLRQIASFVSYFRNYSSWEGKTGIHIGDLWVSPAIRGQGVGSALLRHVLAQNEGKRIDVFVIRNNEARIFYERLGFKEQTEWCLYRMEADE